MARNRRHSAEEIVNKLRQAEVELEQGLDDRAGMQVDRGDRSDLLPMTS